MLQDPVQLRTALLAKVKELGYDGFVYKNRYEDKGNISYVILDPNQVKVLEVSAGLCYRKIYRLTLKIHLIL